MSTNIMNSSNRTIFLMLFFQFPNWRFANKFKIFNTYSIGIIESFLSFVSGLIVYQKIAQVDLFDTFVRVNAIKQFIHCDHIFWKIIFDS